MEKNLKSLLIDGLKKTDSSYCTDMIVSKLEKYFDLLKLFNPALGLVSASDEMLVTRHILDSLYPLPYIQSLASEFFKNENRSISVADLGSGNGMPGLVLSCIKTDWNFSLVERMGRRAGFLRNAVAVMQNTQNVKVVESDIKNVKEKFDLIVMRAFRPFELIETEVNRLCKERALIFVWSKEAEAEHGVKVFCKDYL